MAGKKVGPPRGAGAAADAVVAAGAARESETDRIGKLSNRYQDDRPAEALNWGPPRTPTSPPPITAPAPAGEATGPARTPRRPPRSEPAGMTRRTYYLPESAAEALAAAVDRIQAATRGQVTKHEALAAVITAGVAQADDVADRLRADLLRRLSNK